MAEIYILNEKRENMIAEYVNAGAHEAYIPAIKSTSRYSCFDYLGDLNEDPLGWPNTVMAKHYGVDKIVRDNTISLQ